MDMVFKNLKTVLSKPKYFFIFLLVAVIVGSLYIGLLTNPKLYNASGWFFAIAMPLLVGAIVAVQVYNLKERTTCPANATAGGVLGGITGIITVACPMCPAVLLGWIGLGATIPATILGGPWLKLISLVILALGLYWAAK